MVAIELVLGGSKRWSFLSREELRPVVPEKRLRLVVFCLLWVIFSVSKFII